MAPDKIAALALLGGPWKCLGNGLGPEPNFRGPSGRPAPEAAKGGHPGGFAPGGRFAWQTRSLARTNRGPLGLRPKVPFSPAKKRDKLEGMIMTTIPVQTTVRVEMVEVSQLTKNVDLSYGFSEGQVKKLSKIIFHYGDICPLIVIETEDKGMYKILKGQDVYEAAKINKLKKVKALILTNIGEFDDKLIPLSFSVLKSEIGAIAQGVIINQLIKDHGFFLENLSKHCGVSKSWLCKRQSLANNLVDSVKKFVCEGKIAPRTAEEIAKLPPEKQAHFAGKVIEHGMAKDRASELVRLFRDSHTDESLRQRIINEPDSVSLIDHTLAKKPKKKAERIPMTLNKSINYAINAIENVKNQLSRAGKDALLPLSNDVRLLGAKAGELASLAASIAGNGK